MNMITKHGWGYVHSYPYVTFFCEDFAREARATADVEDKGGDVGTVIRYNILDDTVIQASQSLAASIR
jgi:hypothetical protein